MFHRLLFALVLLTGTTAVNAFTPHADCTFNKIDPLPEVENCDALDRRIKSIKSNMAAAQRAMDKLRQDHGDAIDDLLEQGMEILVGEVTGIPTSAADCVTAAVSYCSQRIGAALSAASNLLSASGTFQGGIDAAIWYRRWQDKLRDLEKDLQEAEEELAECEARRSEQATARDDAEAYNRAGVPKYPADHPLCKPPEEAKPDDEEVKDDPDSGDNDTTHGGSLFSAHAYVGQGCRTVQADRPDGFSRFGQNRCHTGPSVRPHELPDLARRIARSEHPPRKGQSVSIAYRAPFAANGPCRTVGIADKPAHVFR